MNKTLLCLTVLVLTLSVDSAPAPSYLVFTDYGVNNFDVELCDLRGDLTNCTRYESTDTIQINTNRDWYIKIVPDDIDFIEMAMDKANYENMRAIIFVCILLIIIALFISSKK